MIARAMLMRPLLTNCPLRTHQVKISKDAVRLIRNEARSGSFGIGSASGQSTRMSLKEKLMQPTTGLPFAVGRGVVLGATALGLGALAFYGAGLGSEAGAFDRSLGWDHVVRERIRSTYMYFGTGLVSSAAAASAILRSPRLMTIVSNNSIMACVATMAAVIVSSMVVHAIDYSPGFGPKQMAFVAHTAMIGAILAPLAFVGGPVLIRAALYTAGIAGGLSTIAACAPSEKFLNWGAPLAIGLGGVFAANIGALFLPPHTAIGAGLASIVVYGGLVLFSAFLLYDTQRIIKKAETHPQWSPKPYDPVNASLSIYMDVINIFIRLVMIFGGGGSRKK